VTEYGWGKSKRTSLLLKVSFWSHIISPRLPGTFRLSKYNPDLMADKEVETGAPSEQVYYLVSRVRPLKAGLECTSILGKLCDQSMTHSHSLSHTFTGLTADRFLVLLWV
jgi:hypothetical protein